MLASRLLRNRDERVWETMSDALGLGIFPLGRGTFRAVGQWARVR